METKATVGDSGTISSKKCGDFHGYHKLDVKSHQMTLSDTAAIPGSHANLFSVTKELKKNF